MEAQSVETAWRIHEQQADWTGKVDSKAAFAFTVHSLLLTFAVSLMVEVDRWYVWVIFSVGGVLLVAGAITAASVVAPQLRRRGLAGQARHDYIYFGHARHWSPADLTTELRTTDALPVVVRQITVMADIAWKKHVRVGWSIWLGVVGGVLILAAAVILRLVA